MRDAIIIEKANGNYSADAPDLPGCVATGETVAAVESEIRDAIRFHIDGLKEDGLPVPAPTRIADYGEARGAAAARRHNLDQTLICRWRAGANIAI
jgi:predicted RNase H-like HicB family nuclease